MDISPEPTFEISRISPPVPVAIRHSHTPLPAPSREIPDVLRAFDADAPRRRHQRPPIPAFCCAELHVCNRTYAADGTDMAESYMELIRRCVAYLQDQRQDVVARIQTAGGPVWEEFVDGVIARERTGAQQADVLPRSNIFGVWSASDGEPCAAGGAPSGYTFRGDNVDRVIFTDNSLPGGDMLVARLLIPSYPEIARPKFALFIRKHDLVRGVDVTDRFVGDIGFKAPEQIRLKPMVYPMARFWEGINGLIHRDVVVRYHCDHSEMRFDVSVADISWGQPPVETSPRKPVPPTRESTTRISKKCAPSRRRIVLRTLPTKEEKPQAPITKSTESSQHVEDEKVTAQRLQALQSDISNTSLDDSESSQGTRRKRGRPRKNTNELKHPRHQRKTTIEREMAAVEAGAAQEYLSPEKSEA